MAQEKLKMLGNVLKEQAKHTKGMEAKFLTELARTDLRAARAAARRR